MNVLITGVSSGLGQSLMRSFINKGHEVYGLSRNKVDECHHICCDLADLNSIEGKLNRLLDEVSQLDLVILNAGMLGNIKTIDNWSLNELTEIMNINVWSNKVLLDWILNNKKCPICSKPWTQISHARHSSINILNNDDDSDQKRLDFPDDSNDDELNSKKTT